MQPAHPLARLRAQQMTPLGERDARADINQRQAGAIGTTLQQAYNQSVDDVFFQSQSYKF
jgi:hypothetical protein